MKLLKTKRKPLKNIAEAEITKEDIVLFADETTHILKIETGKPYFGKSIGFLKLSHCLRLQWIVRHLPNGQ